MTGEKTRRNRIQLLLIFGIAAASFIGSYVLYFATRDGALWGTVNNGEFVSPPAEAAQFGLSFADGTPYEADGLWWLWVVSAGPCDDDCSEAVHQLRQLQVLLAKDASRVRRALVGAMPDPRIERFRSDYPKLDHVTGGGAAALDPGVYIVDPRGFLVLRYGYDQAGKPVLEDLKRMLKVSQIG